MIKKIKPYLKIKKIDVLLFCMTDDFFVQFQQLDFKIENEKVSLETIGDVILASSWLLHGCKVLQVLTCLEIAPLIFIKEVETTVLNH